MMPKWIISMQLIMSFSWVSGSVGGCISQSVGGHIPAGLPSSECVSGVSPTSTYIDTPLDQC